MNAVANEPVWSDLQVSCLQAMGHTVYLDRATADVLQASSVDVADSAPVSAPDRKSVV